MRFGSGITGYAFAWIDVLYIMMAGFAMLFIALVATIPPEVKKDSPEMKAELLITLTWPDQSGDDIDLHLQLPDESVVSFAGKNKNGVTLERDDLGFIGGDTYIDADGKIKAIEINKEVITFRALPPGRYHINVHVYRAYSAGQVDTLTNTPIKVTLPYEAKVEITKLNPTVTIVGSKTFTITENGQGIPVLSFDILPDGTVANIDTNTTAMFLNLVTR